MELLRTVQELRAWSDAQRSPNGGHGAVRRIALVPTMGALHAGHVSLIAEARRRADAVVASIFVNPTQFAPHEDLASYPRDLEGDLETCRAAGVDAVFAPDAAELYPPGAQTFVEVTELQQPLCGGSRPHFFRGVATVVAKLLIAARPHVAVFGEKDFQQLQVVKRLARDLLLDVEIVGAPIVREADGLAMSSRNAYLDERARADARVLSRALAAAEAAVAAGERDGAALLEAVRKEIGRAPRAAVDYAELRDPETLAPLAAVSGPTLLALAVRLPVPTPAGERMVRLIDNRVLRPQAPPVASGHASPKGEVDPR